MSLQDSTNYDANDHGDALSPVYPVLRAPHNVLNDKETMTKDADANDNKGTIGMDTNNVSFVRTTSPGSSSSIVMVTKINGTSRNYRLIY